MAAFDQIYAVDPNNSENVAENGVISIFAPGTRTLLPLKTVTGSPLSNPLQLNARGFGPAFLADGYTEVAWEAIAPGEVFQGTFKSYAGVLQETVAARTAAQQAAETAGAAAAEVVEQKIAAGEFKGEPGRDGSNVVPTDEAIAAAITTPGAPANTALSATFATKVELAGTDVDPVYTTVAWTPTSKARPLAADKTRIFGLGSSSLGNMQTAITSAIAGQATWGAAYTNWAEAGERFEHALARAGVIPSRLTFPNNTIPASGAVTVACDLPTTNFMRSYYGSVSGIYGTLSLASGVFTFTRATAGTAVTTTAGAQFIPSPTTANGTPSFPSFRDAVAILDVGKNNTGDEGAADRINAALDLMVDWLVPYVKSFVVLGHFVDTNATLTQKKNVAKVNAYRAAKYGTRFIDLQTYLTGSQVWADTGITPTQADLDQQGKGEKPTALSRDDLHMNTTVEGPVVTKLIMPKLAAVLGKVFYGPNPVVTSDAFTGGNMSNINGRVTDVTYGGDTAIWKSDINFGGINNGQLVTGTNTSMIALPSATADVEFTVKVPTLPTASSINVMARASSTAADINNNAYRATLASGGSLILGRRSAGSTVTISTGTHTVAAGDTIGVRAVGSQISLIKNGVAVETVADATLANGPWAGVSVVGTTGSALDDVKLRAITDVTKL